MIRAKFHCNSVTFHGDPTNPDATRQYTLNAISDTSTPENERFSRYTPYAELKISVDNPAARLEVGKIYYLDFTEADVSSAA